MKKTDFDWNVGIRALIITILWCSAIMAMFGLVAYSFVQLGFCVTVLILTMVLMFVFIFMFVYSELLVEKYKEDDRGNK